MRPNVFNKALPLIIVSAFLALFASSCTDEAHERMTCEEMGYFDELDDLRRAVGNVSMVRQETHTQKDELTGVDTIVYGKTYQMRTIYQWTSNYGFTLHDDWNAEWNSLAELQPPEGLEELHRIILEIIQPDGVSQIDPYRTMSQKKWNCVQNILPPTKSLLLNANSENPWM